MGGRARHPGGDRARGRLQARPPLGRDLPPPDGRWPIRTSRSAIGPGATKSRCLRASQDLPGGSARDPAPPLRRRGRAADADAQGDQGAPADSRSCRPSSAASARPRPAESSRAPVSSRPPRQSGYRPRQRKAWSNRSETQRFPAPPTDCLSPIGEERILASLREQIDADSSSRSHVSPSVYRGNPFQIEVGLAYGGDLPADDLIRYIGSPTESHFSTNRAPVLFTKPRFRRPGRTMVCSRAGALYPAARLF